MNNLAARVSSIYTSMVSLVQIEWNNWFLNTLCSHPVFTNFWNKQHPIRHPILASTCKLFLRLQMNAAIFVLLKNFKVKFVNFYDCSAFWDSVIASVVETKNELTQLKSFQIWWLPEHVEREGSVWSPQLIQLECLIRKCLPQTRSSRPTIKMCFIWWHKSYFIRRPSLDGVTTNWHHQPQCERQSFIMISTLRYLDAGAIKYVDGT